MRAAHTRKPQELQTRFGQECAIDELALAAGVAPLAFRLQRLKEEREIAVVEPAAEEMGWQLRASRAAGGKVWYAQCLRRFVARSRLRPARRARPRGRPQPSRAARCRRSPRQMA